MSVSRCEGREARTPKRWQRGRDAWSRSSLTCLAEYLILMRDELAGVRFGRASCRQSSTDNVRVPEPVRGPPGRAGPFLLQRRDLVADGSLPHRGQQGEPIQVAADMDAPGPHHLYPGAVGVAGPRHHFYIGGAAQAHHEVADRHAEYLAQPHARLRQQGEDQPVAEVALPVSRRGVPGRAAVDDRLDLLWQQERG